ncbi:MAG TPA: hypothetical protein VHS53_06910 [Mucilaginibacter sp.]|nr:hypothetical protein [Mucilaginibacter sp.]
MRRKLNEKQLQFYNAIDKILWNDWDPLGLNQYEDWPTDEYENYVPTIFSLKIRGASVEAFAQRLYEIEIKQMGQNDGFEKCKQVAEKIFRL